MAIDLITGHQGIAHISAEQVADIQKAEMGGYGDGKVMRMSDGGVTYSGLTVTVAEGYWRVNGYDMQIQDAEDILIDPTTAGNHRIDIVYATILQDIPSGVQRSELRVVQGEETTSTPSAPDKPTTPILTNDALLQIEEVCRVSVSGGAMTFTDKTIPFQMANPDDITKTQAMIATVEASSTASRAYAVGEQLVYNGLLYKVTSAISQGGTLTVGTNIALSDNVTTQIKDVSTQVSNISTQVSNIKAAKYGTSSTGSSTTKKVVTTTSGDFTLTTGSSVFVEFTYQNTASSPTLEVDGKTATAIKGYGTTKPSTWWKAGDVVEFVYDGSYFIMQPSQGQISTLDSSIPSLSWSDVSSSLSTGSAASYIVATLEVCPTLRLAHLYGKAVNAGSYTAWGSAILIQIGSSYRPIAGQTGFVFYNSNIMKTQCGFMSNTGAVCLNDSTALPSPCNLYLEIMYRY